ncbi:uncharacterized protein FRV6_16583 [Fusarium oxysporum]|uniref:PiggyBac transposable element-derived protein domain-containing protein n=1 Tax=Fusarium oxysporum TaxID=5507 RepID=A0A2H3TXU5_FUSOX|nr:uncharacterized protein FRV6_16583 [Fusarium oxysporum]
MIAKTPLALNNTQSFVIHLVNMLPKATPHVFVDNLFSSPNLFRALRKSDYGATGTARPNCGISQELKELKGKNKSRKSGLNFNEVKVIFTKDKKTSAADRFVCVCLNNLSSQLQVPQIVWKDDSLVLFLSTVYSSKDDQRTRRERTKPAGKETHSEAIQSL